MRQPTTITRRIRPGRTSARPVEDISHNTSRAYIWCWASSSLIWHSGKLLIISPSFDINWQILSVGTNTFSALIATRFGDANASQLSALLTAGFVLFVMTIAINTIAAVFVGRSRSGSATEI